VFRRGQQLAAQHDPVAVVELLFGGHARQQQTMDWGGLYGIGGMQALGFDAQVGVGVAHIGEIDHHAGDDHGLSGVVVVGDEVRVVDVGDRRLIARRAES